MITPAPRSGGRPRKAPRDQSRQIVVRLSLPAQAALVQLTAGGSTVSQVVEDALVALARSLHTPA